MNLWVFDNDGTLYDDSKTHQQFFEIMAAYFAPILNVPPDQVKSEGERLKKWSTDFSIIAFVKEHGIDFTEAVKSTYLGIDFQACGIPVASSLQVEAIKALEGKKIVFTNNPAAWARRVLLHLGIADCFSEIIGMEEMQFYGKPHPASYKVVEDRHSGFDKIIFCDDSLKNLDEARRCGWLTVWLNVHKEFEPANSGHVVITSLEEITKVL